MTTPRKKKMAKYMIDDLLAIAKKQIIKLNPCLDIESIMKKMAQEYADKQKEVLLKKFPQNDMKILEKYKKAYIQQSFDLPHTSVQGQLGILLPDSWRWQFSDDEYEKNQAEYARMVDEEHLKIRKEMEMQLKPYKNLLNSVGYLEDVIKHWDNKEVEEYISKKSECIVCTALVTLTDADVKIIKMNEKLLQEKENGSSVN